MECPLGQDVAFEGVVVELGSRQRRFDVAPSITLRDDRGFVVTGTRPALLSDARPGDRVAFAARVTERVAVSRFRAPRRARFLARV